ncbi:MAG: serine hydrolase [Gemmatimonadales bacterium]|nr:serine hydrolase [Gemmatimonadales bacterium]NIQ98633.1 serine hydrolase [Gemmatimonadales bacterium]
MTRKTAVLCAIALVSVLAFGSNLSPTAEGKKPQQVRNAEFDAVKAMILKEIEERTIPSASVAVAKDGEIIWLESFGWADVERKIKATPHTPYPIASITKTMTATAVMLLAERGELDIRQPVEDYVAPLKLTAYKGNSRDVTVKHLLNHAGGLAMHFDYYYEDEEYVPPSVPEAIERYGFLIHAPGEVFQYANLGYALLGHMISKVTGTEYEDFLRTEVFERLGMNHTWVGSHSDGPSPVTSKYDGELGIIPQVLPYAVAAGAAFSSAYDLVRFGMFHLKDRIAEQERILRDATIEAMQSDKDATAKYGSEDYYGFGWFFRESEGATGSAGTRAVWEGQDPS